MKILSHIHPRLLESASQAFSDIEVIQIPQEGELPEHVEGEVLLTQAWGSPNLAECVERGVNAFPFDQVGDAVLTCARGASAIPISEWVLAVMLAFEKQLPDSWISQPPERWNMAELGGLHGRTLGLIGLGGIGEAVATRALAFDMRVLAHRRTGRPSEIDGVSVVQDLNALLEAADHLVLAAAATPETRHIVNRESLGRVKPGVHLVNSLLDRYIWQPGEKRRTIAQNEEKIRNEG